MTTQEVLAPVETDQSHLDVIARLRGQIDAVLGPIAAAHGNAPYALLDFPNYSNVGDSAIFSGQVAFFHDRIKSRPACVSEVGTPEERDTIPEAGPIYLTGGGNFGDIYPRHQTYREAILARFPKRSVVQLPQSLHYDAASGIQATARVIASHPDFTLLVRDQESFDLASRDFDCKVLMCPDLAFAIGPLARRRQAYRDVLLLLRTDEETTNPFAGLTLPAGWQIEDWLGEPRDTFARASRLAKIKALKSFDPRRLAGPARVVDYYEALAETRVERGLHQLSSARYVITDRLHAHILCTLLGIPHTFLDNYYGKISRFSAAFGTRWKGVSRATSAAEALGIAEAHIAKS